MKSFLCLARIPRRRGRSTPKGCRFPRKLLGVLYIGENCDLYTCEDGIHAVQDGDFSYDVWNGSAYEHVAVSRMFTQAEAVFEAVDEPFAPPYAEQLCFGGVRKRTWKKITVSGAEGFVQIPDQYDVAQIYAEGVLVADHFYYGTAWRVPAKLFYKKECYLVMSEMREDFTGSFDAAPKNIDLPHSFLEAKHNAFSMPSTSEGIETNYALYFPKHTS